MKEPFTFDQLPTAVNQLGEKLDNIERLLLEKNEQQSAIPPDQLLTIQEAAEMLHLSVPTLYSKVSRGELPVMKRTKRLYFSRDDLSSYIRAGRKKTNAEIVAEAETFLKPRKGHDE